MKKAVFFRIFYCILLVSEKMDQKGILCRPLQGEEQNGENRGKYFGIPNFSALLHKDSCNITTVRLMLNLDFCHKGPTQQYHDNVLIQENF